MIFCFYFQTFGVENHTGDALEAAHPIPVHPVPPPPPPPPPNLPGVTTTVTTAVAPNINVKSYSSSSGPGHQNNNQFNNSNNKVDNNSDTTKVVTTMKSQNHTSVNCAVKVPAGVSRGQNGPNANKNNTPHPHVGGGVGANSDNCTMPKRPRTKNTSGGGPGIPPYVGITTNKNPEPVRKEFL